MERKEHALTGILFLLPSLAGVSVFVLIPFLDVTLRSFQNAVTRSWVGLDNYRVLFQTPAFRLAARNTLRFTGICIPILICVSLFISVFLQRQKRLRSLLKSAFLLPMAVQVASVVLLWRVTFHADGFLSLLAVHTGHAAADWMNTGYAFWVLVFSYIWKNLGYDMVLWLAGLSAIPQEQYEAAQVQGAGRWSCFRYITMPQMKETVFVTALLSFINAFRVFREAYLIAGDYPHDSIYMLQHLFNNWFTNLDIQKMTAAAVLLMLGIGGVLGGEELWRNHREKRERQLGQL